MLASREAPFAVRISIRMSIYMFIIVSNQVKSVQVRSDLVISECVWGPSSKKIILLVEIKYDAVCVLVFVCGLICVGLHRRLIL